MSAKPGTCSFKTCHNIPESGKRLCRRCLDRANRKRKERISSGLCNNCNRPAVEGCQACEPCRQRRHEYAKANRLTIMAHRRYREIVLNYYGKRCACCGETNPVFLTIDHINGRQNAPERKQTGYNVSTRIARAIIMGKPRTDIRILCFNCNCGRQRNGGVCPHQENANGS